MTFHPSLEQNLLTWTSLVKGYDNQTTKQHPKYRASPDFCYPGWNWKIWRLAILLNVNMKWYVHCLRTRDFNCFFGRLNVLKSLRNGERQTKYADFRDHLGSANCLSWEVVYCHRHTTNSSQDFVASPLKLNQVKTKSSLIVFHPALQSSKGETQ